MYEMRQWTIWVIGMKFYGIRCTHKNVLLQHPIQIQMQMQLTHHRKTHQIIKKRILEQLTVYTNLFGIPLDLSEEI